jgi:hypothetical protein
MQSSGPIGGNPGDQFIGTMPISYSFSITPGTISCLTTSPCDVSVQWSLLFLIQGPGVNNSDGASGSANGIGTGSISGGLSVPAPGYCSPPFCVTAPPMTISQNSDPNTVSASLSLFVTLPEDASATFSISVPQVGSFDFHSAENAPEPATMGLLAAGLLLFGYRRLTSRS